MVSTPLHEQDESRRGRGAGWVTSLCWVAVLLDGFDLVVVGTVVPTLRTPAGYDLSPGGATAVVTIGLVGMMIGALATGALTDRFGRRRALIGAVAFFSLFTLLCAVAPNAEVFGALRFLAGLGLGGCLPTAIAMVNEFSRGSRSGQATTRVMTGYHVGAVLTAGLAIVVVEPLGWRWMFVIGALPALVVVPLMLRRLPESPAHLLATGRRADAERVAAQHGLALAEPALDAGGAPEATSTLGTLFGSAYRRTTLVVGLTSFMGLLLVYGLNNWLPTIMREADYDLGDALAFLLVLNVGAIVGLLVAGRVADRIGIRAAGIGWFAAAAVFLALLSVRLPIAGIYVMVFLTGCFVFSAQVLVYAFVSANHPPQVRATALGWSAGAGRIGAITGPVITGALLTAGLAFPWGFYLFSAVGVVGALSLVAARASRAGAPG
ncbi:MFS transporter [Modestobacter sp. I12A-02628]|uniref:Aromatic acid/H+ symport family MFS transporter n=1 Tax=Goekera deserti TaxID=2497753 RepID=A0A7K3WEC9_9ACTN|nr:aromatic acid/H+ symport family MFS transporter [Goekera deserti]MPQ96995.1 MFS transporter [Goekera deserti]NDI46690.1 MFS transporter [Goekera deserti]NEL54259.1 aromatic acid/H+ symport family MFS transporter [Goekera deserti]